LGFPALGFAALFRKICKNKTLRLLGIPPKLIFWLSGFHMGLLKLVLIFVSFESTSCRIVRYHALSRALTPGFTGPHWQALLTLLGRRGKIRFRLPFLARLN
jgi:hypothetical protein